MMNSVNMIGRLVRDPEVKSTPGGVLVSRVTLAVNRTYKNKEGVREADFINVVFWRKTAEFLGKYTKKGTLISVEGRLQTRSYENKEGSRVFVTEVICGQFNLLEKKSNDGEEWVKELDPKEVVAGDFPAPSIEMEEYPF